jgi:hypothetical protein
MNREGFGRRHRTLNFTVRVVHFAGVTDKSHVVCRHTSRESETGLRKKVGNHRTGMIHRLNDNSRTPLCYVISHLQMFINC